MIVEISQQVCNLVYKMPRREVKLSYRTRPAFCVTSKPILNSRRSDALAELWAILRRQGKRLAQPKIEPEIEDEVKISR